MIARAWRPAPVSTRHGHDTPWGETEISRDVGDTHTWFSPLGDRNHAPTHMAAMMNRPMKMLHLEAQRQHMQTAVSPSHAYARGWIQAYPLAILKGLAVWRVGMMGASSIVTGWTGDDARLPASRWAYRVGAPLT